MLSFASSFGVLLRKRNSRMRILEVAIASRRFDKMSEVLVQSTLLMRLILTVLNESYTYTELKRDVVDSTFGEDAVIVPCKRIEAYK